MVHSFLSLRFSLFRDDDASMSDHMDHFDDSTISIKMNGSDFTEMLLNRCRFNHRHSISASLPTSHRLFTSIIRFSASRLGQQLWSIIVITFMTGLMWNISIVNARSETSLISWFLQCHEWSLCEQWLVPYIHIKHYHLGSLSSSLIVIFFFIVMVDETIQLRWMITTSAFQYLVASVLMTSQFSRDILSGDIRCMVTIQQESCFFNIIEGVWFIVTVRNQFPCQ